jgi:hypothetical protein
VAAPAVVLLAAAVSAPAAPDVNSAAAVRGAGYLTGQLVGGTHLAFTGTTDADYGLTADVAIALASTGSQDPALGRIVGYLAAHVADYADPAGTGAFPGPYGGAVGKLALVAEITGQDPHAFGGFDLLAALTSHVCTTADAASAAAGTCTAVGDFYQAYSGISQALGVLALARGSVPAPAVAVTRLEQLQCPDGGFSSTLIAPGAACTSDVDATGYAVQALRLVDGTALAVGRAQSFLLTAQGATGGYTGAAGINANSTGLAVQALIALSSGVAPASAVDAAATPASAVDAGLAFLLTQQNADGGFDPSSTIHQSDARATSQAVPALVRTTLMTLRHPVISTAPTSTAPTSAPPSSAPPSSAPPTSGTTTAPAATTPSARSSSAGAGVVAGATTPAATDQGELAATGIDANRVTWHAVLAGSLLAAGCATLLLSRRRPTAPAAARHASGSRRH